MYLPRWARLINLIAQCHPGKVTKTLHYAVFLKAASSPRSEHLQLVGRKKRDVIGIDWIDMQVGGEGCLIDSIHGETKVTICLCVNGWSAQDSGGGYM